MPVTSCTLSVSVVTFKPDIADLSSTFQSLWRSLKCAKDRCAVSSSSLILVNNSPIDVSVQEMLELLEVVWKQEESPYQVISGHGNIGYGRAHNMAIERSSADYHLIMNPDVILAEDAIVNALVFMQTQPEVGLLAPSVQDEYEEHVHLCKNYPSVLDLVLRGFAPEFVKTRFNARLARYELQSVNASGGCYDVPLVSGSFMFFRRSVLEKTGGFSSDYFLYFEDYDLSLRTAKHTRVCYVPNVRIAHAGGQASRKGLKHVLMFSRSAVTFFSQHGWKWF